MNARGTESSSFAGSSEQRYEIVRKIAAGGMATVYLGRGVGALGFERPVAIKICHPHLLEATDRTQALLDEARIAALIRHPNVVATLDVALRDSAVMIVMEYVEGVTVAGLIKAAARAEGRVPIPIALRIAEDALAGLHAAHELRAKDGTLVGVVHRDVSPQNVIVGVDGFAKLADFGVFKGELRTAVATASGEVKGKLGYVAPEVYEGAPATRRSDVYALGVVLWELCAGRRLFDEAEQAATMHRVLAGAVPALSSLRADAPLELDAVLARALALDPADRYATAEDLSRALEALAIGTASPRMVAAHVREASTVEGTSSLAPTSLPEDATPHEHVTPVVPDRARARLPLFAWCLTLAVLAFVILQPRALSSSPTPAVATPPLHVPVPVPVPVPDLSSPSPSSPSPAPSSSASRPPRAPFPLPRPRARPSPSPARPTPTVFDPPEL